MAGPASRWAEQPGDNEARRRDAVGQPAAGGTSGTQCERAHEAIEARSIHGKSLADRDDENE